MQSPLSPGKIILYESQLQMIPPKDKLFVNWKKRWFTLARTDPFNPAAIELTYYSDSEKKEAKGTINLGRVTKINPSQGKPKDHIFSIETHDKKYVLKASDEKKKTIWLCKLMECFSKDGTTFHVSIPSQPTCGYREAIIRLSTPLRVDIVSPIDHAPVMVIPFDQIRRFGCQVMADSDVVWIETCYCKGGEQELYFFTVASGIETAYHIVQEIKKSIEITLRSLLIMEEGNAELMQFSFITRMHYGCNEYSQMAKENVLHAGLVHLAACHGSGGAISMTQMNRLRHHRPSVPYTSAYPLINAPSMDRRHTAADVFNGGLMKPEPGLLPSSRSPGPSPRHSPAPSSPSHSPSPHSPLPPHSPRQSPLPPYTSPQSSPLAQRNQRTLANLKPGMNLKNGLSHSAGAAEFDSGITLEAPDPSRFSAPSYLLNSSPASVSVNLPASKDKRFTLDDMRKMKSSHECGTGASSGGGRKKSLADLQYHKGSLPRPNRKKSREERRDSAVGGSDDLIIEDHDGRLTSRYNHLPPPPTSPRGGASLAAYDHLSASFGGMSLKTAFMDSKRKHSDAYV